MFDIYGFYVFGRRGYGVEKGGIFFDDAEPGFVVGRKYFHWFAGAAGDGSWLDDNLVVIQVELHLVAKLFKDFHVSSEFIDFVFEIRENVGGVVGFDKINDTRYNIFTRFCVYEHEGNIEFFELLLH